MFSRSREIGVCLRCQYRLYRRAARSNFRQPPSSTRSFTQDSRHNQQASQAPNDANEDHENAIRIRREIVDGSATKWRSLGLHEEEIPLGVNTLGEPAAIRVLRDRPRRPEALDVPTTRPEVPYDDLMKRFQEENGSSTPKEVHRHIETIRAAFLAKISSVEGPTEKECEEVSQTIQNGFKTVQLEGYIKAVGTFTPSSVDNLDAFLAIKNCRRSRWFAGRSKWPEDALIRVHPKSGRGLEILYTPPPKALEEPNKKVSKKKVLARTILQTCWGLRSQEEKMSSGSVAMRIEKGCLELLLKQSESIFNQMQQVLSITLDIDPELELVRINGQYEACDIAARAIINELQEIEEKRLRVFTSDLRYKAKSFLKLNLPKLWYEGAVGKYIEGASNTIIRTNVRGQETFGEIRILYFRTEEQSVLDIQRYLSRIRGLSAQVRFDIFLYPLSHYEPTSVVPVETNDDLPFHDRRSKWFRWRDIASPVRRTTSSEVEKPRYSFPSQGSKQMKAISTSLVSAWKNIDYVPRHDAFKEQWKPQPQTTIVAALGMICYALADVSPYDKLSMDIKQKEQSEKQLALNLLGQERRTLVTSVPGVLPTIEKLVSGTWTIKHCIKILLEPTEAFYARGRCTAPSLELEIGLDDNARTTGLSRARLINNERVTDLLLAKQGADLRFISQCWFEADLANIDPSILTFLANSSLEIGKARLQTPPLLKLAVPFATCRPSKKAALDKNPKNQTSGARKGSSFAERRRSKGTDAAQQVDVEYTLNSLSVISQVKALYEGFDISVSTIEAGKMGGRKQEVRIEAPGIANEEVLALHSVARRKRLYPLANQQFLGLYAAVIELVARIPW